jgi:hypothetical protein
MEWESTTRLELATTGESTINVERESEPRRRRAPQMQSGRATEIESTIERERAIKPLKRRVPQSMSEPATSQESTVRGERATTKESTTE